MLETLRKITDKMTKCWVSEVASAVKATTMRAVVAIRMPRLMYHLHISVAEISGAETICPIIRDICTIGINRPAKITGAPNEI